MGNKLLLLLSLCLTACVKPEVVYQTQVKYQTLPEMFIQDCDLVTPPDKDVYLSKNFTDREGMLTDKFISAMESIHKCNTRLKQAREYNQQIKQLFEVHDAQPIKNDT